jgi:thioesterase domain-containing protein/acyl carrier protein
MSTPAETSTTRAARSADDIRHWIVNELSRSLKIHPAHIDPVAALDSLGIDSLAAIGMTGGLAAWLQRDLPATLLWDYASINAIAEALADPEARPACPGVITFQPDGDHCPVFFFPGQGGHPVTFAALATHFAGERRCYGLTIPGLYGEQEPKSRIEDIAAIMRERIRRVQPDGPYQLAGYSFGGLLAYEIALQLLEEQQAVSMLALYDTFTPDGRKIRPGWQRLALHAYLLATRGGRIEYLRTRLEKRRKRAKKDPDQPRATAVFSPSHQNIKKVEAANAAAFKAYRPRPYPGEVLLFRANDRALHNIFYSLDQTAGWGALAKAVRVIDLPGTHLGILSGEHSRAAADLLRAHLRTVQ